MANTLFFLIYLKQTIAKKTFNIKVDTYNQIIKLYFYSNTALPIYNIYIPI